MIADEGKPVSHAVLEFSVFQTAPPSVAHYTFFSYIFSPKVHPHDAFTSHWAGEGYGFGFQPLRADFIHLFIYFGA